ncbi:GAF domain-containing protein [Methanoregula sp.]|uniref:hybrid sensor histidine kinase/response regulator n=1 Tax=Methanoregula sp. TaxID=2052170 RepID=UPI003C7899D4
MISVLYVDDDPAFLDLCKLFLERTNEFTVITASSVSGALELLKSNGIHAIVSDYQMPEMDGIAFLKQVRATDNDIPFIMFTGKGREEIAILAFEFGADFYVQKGGAAKPQFAELIHKIKAAVEHRRAYAEVTILNRLYSVVSRTNRAMIRIHDRQELLDEACRIAVEEGKFLMAWIGMVDPATHKVRPVAACGYEAGYLSRLSITVDNVPQGMGLTGIAIREGHPTVSNDIPSDPRMAAYYDEAAKRGYCSSAGFPLRNGSTVVGAMRFYSGESNFFNERELQLLQELTDDISFALEMMERDSSLTELKRMSKAIQVANRKLNLLNSIIRHDILNTVTGLLGLEDMAIALISDRELSQLIREIKDTTRRIQQQITFTRDYQDIGVHSPQWQNVNNVISNVTKTTSLGSIKLSVIPDKDPEIFADSMLEKVFYNLVDNALRYGGKLTAITFSLRQSDEGLIIICEDNGNGIPDAEKEKIFERGFGKNTGQGLFLAREILSITGITIRETGEPGKGARFEIVVPGGSFRICTDTGSSRDPTIL